MGWRDLLQADDEAVVSAWVGGRTLRTRNRTWTIEGRLPPEHGWHSFSITGRKARWKEPADAPMEVLFDLQRGYLVGDRLVADHVEVELDPAKLAQRFERVHLVEEGLDRFARIAAGRVCDDGPLIYEGPDMPLGPEDDVLQAFLDRKGTVDAVSGVPPALDAAFRFESWQRSEAERRRREERERREREERRRRIMEQVGSAAGRRAMAREDFGEAARAALAMGNAEYLDHRRAAGRNEMIVRFRMNRRRFECTCDAETLRIIDSGICLTSHDTGKQYDNYFTLESLPGVIEDAERQGVLVVFRHVD
jgi:hypothetical protein